MKRSSTPAQSRPNFLNYTIASDIQFSDQAMTSPVANTPFQQHSQQQQHQYLCNPQLDGPFQVIEPGSEHYIEMDSDYCFDPFDGSGLMEQQELFISENGIPQEVLNDIFQLDDEIEAAGCVVPHQYPVAGGLSMKEYENQLVAEMEKLFPEANSTGPAKPLPRSRLMEELVKTGPQEIPCYMSVQLGGETKKGNKMNITTRDARRGFRCVDMIDGNGTAFKAKFYDHHAIEKQSKPVPPAKNPIQHRRVAELLKSPSLKNLSPAMASKIESLASGTRNVTLAPVRHGSTASGNSPTTTIVIKTPKRTIASNTTLEPPPPLAPVADFPFPMPLIKQEPPDEPHQSTSFEATPIDVPVIMPTLANNKQPRKQKLQSLSRCDVEFKETTNAPSTVAGPSGSGVSRGPPTRKLVPRTHGRPPNDFVTITMKDVNSNTKEQSLSIRPSTSRASSAVTIAPSNQAHPPNYSYSFRKRTLVSHYRVQFRPNNKHAPGRLIESIEILDTSDEEDDTNGSSTGTATAPESETEDAPKPKLPGNTESIQCPFCCKVFLSSHALMLHGQICADAVLFGQSTKHQQSSSKEPRKGVSLLKSTVDKSKPTSSVQAEPKKEPDQQSDSKKKRLTSGASRRTISQLSIEILPSNFCIDNLLLCNVCKKTFRSQEHLNVHQNIHKTPTVCQYCKKKFYEARPKHICQEMKRSKQRQ